MGTGLADELLAMDPPALHAFFTRTDAVAITERIRGTDDDELARMVATDQVREEAVTAILSRFPEFADRDRLALVEGVVGFELSRPSGATKRHTVRLAGGSLRLLDETVADVVIGASTVDFVRLVTGQRNAALLYLADRLTIDGDEQLALAVGSVFVVPGTGAVAVDPTALDPVEVATAVAGSSAEHLRAVMRGGFRSIVLGEVCRRFPDFLDAEKARRVRLRVAFRVGGRDDGEVDRFLVVVDRGTCRVETVGVTDAPRDATILLDGADFLRLAMGRLNPVTAVLTGTLAVRGDRAKALALNAVMRPPRPRT